MMATAVRQSYTQAMSNYNTQELFCFANFNVRRMEMLYTLSTIRYAASRHGRLNKIEF